MDKSYFWKDVALEHLSHEQWESLCDGCGRCCLNKLEDEDSGEIVWTNVACSLLDDESCQCGDYSNRSLRVSDCIALTPENIHNINWLPETCGYRLVREGRDLYWWHPLISGDPDTVHMAGISVRGLIVSENDIPVEQYENYLVTWPSEDPFAAKDEETDNLP